MKQATSTPIHKGGSRSEAKPFRPISLTSHFTKIFERVIREKLVTFLEEKNLLNANQHSFRSRRSCLTQLLENYDKILNMVEMGNNVDVIYLDFAKAFEKVDHGNGILCDKLKKLVIGGSIMYRTQYMTANGATSTIKKNFAAEVRSHICRFGIALENFSWPLPGVSLITVYDRQLMADKSV